MTFHRSDSKLPAPSLAVARIAPHRALGALIGVLWTVFVSSCSPAPTQSVDPRTSASLTIDSAAYTATRFLNYYHFTVTARFTNTGPVNIYLHSFCGAGGAPAFGIFRPSGSTQASGFDAGVGCVLSAPLVAPTLVAPGTSVSVTMMLQSAQKAGTVPVGDISGLYQVSVDAQASSQASIGPTLLIPSALRTSEPFTVTVVP